MPEQITTIHLEISPGVPQQDVWDLETRLQQVEGVMTDLQEPKDGLTATLFVLQVTATVMGSVATIGTGVKAMHDMAVILHDFFQRIRKGQIRETGTHNIFLTTKKGARVTISGLSVEEIEQLLRGQ